MDFWQRRGRLLLAILALGILIIVHEGGHFLIARLSGMRVDRFSIGFGPTLFSFKRGETIYQIAGHPARRLRADRRAQPGRRGHGGERSARLSRTGRCGSGWRPSSPGPATNYIFAARHARRHVPRLGRARRWARRPSSTRSSTSSPAAAAGLEPEDEIKSPSTARRSTTATRCCRSSTPRAASRSSSTSCATVKPMTITVTPAKNGSSGYLHGRQARRRADLGAGCRRARASRRR